MTKTPNASFALLAALAFATFPSTVAAQQKERLFSAEYGKLLLQDTRYVLSSPVRWNKKGWLTFSLGALGVGAVALFDKSVQDGIQRNRSTTTDHIAKVFEPFGAEYSFGALGGFYLTGAAFDNPKARSVALDGLSASLIASGIISPALKIAVGRSRPFQNDGVHTFHPFSGNTSFPSGHTTQAFAVSSVIAAHYDPLWVKISAYGVAALVGFARIDHNAHFASDVAAGGLIGAAVGNAVVHFNRQQRTRRQRPPISFAPLLCRDTRGMAMAFTF